MTRIPRLLPLIALPAVSALVLAGCATGAGTDPADTDAHAKGDGTINVVASTNVYGQIAEQIGGEYVEVTSIIASGAQDPHGYEASAQDQLTVSRADLIIENGGGYDSFLDALVEASGSEAHVITAVEHSDDWPAADAGHDDAEEGHVEEEHTEEDAHSDEEEHAHTHVEGFNEHVWYDPHTIEHMTEAIADELGEILPAQAETFAANAADFVAGIEALEEGLAAIAAEHAGAHVFATEPVSAYLVTAANLDDVTPEEFSEAVEEGQDVPPGALLEALGMLESGDVGLVITNAQTGGAETTQVIEAAESAGIAVIEFSETLPEGQTYLLWMQENVEALAVALAE